MQKIQDLEIFSNLFFSETIFLANIIDIKILL